MMDIIEGNKLIAEFMGGVYSDNWTNMVYKEPSENIAFTKETAPTKDASYNWHPASLQYHSSWDWLMPVVEKIEKINENPHGYFGVYVNSNSCTIQGTNFRSDKPPYDVYYAEQIAETKIRSTWQACVAFIQWHNPHTQRGGEQ